MSGVEFPIVHEWGATASKPVPANSYLFQEVFIQSQRCFCRARYRLGGASVEVSPGHWRVSCAKCKRTRKFFFKGVGSSVSGIASTRFERLWSFLDQGMLAAEGRDWGAARSLLEEVASLEPWWGEVHLQLGLIQISQGDFDAAQLRLEQAVSILPLDAEVHEALSRLWEALGDDLKARRHGWLALQLDESDLDVSATGR